MKPLVILCLFFSTCVFAQTIDYNTKKGFAANGYDVVAYFNNTAQEGSKQFTATFDGVAYKFASKTNLNLFKKNPERYAPQYGGYCAYAVALKSDKVKINPKSFLVKNDKLYLFYDAWGTNTLELWQEKNQNELIKKGDNNWNTIKLKNK